MSKQILVLGNGAAGLAAAEEARACCPSCGITVITGEEHLTYSRPMLTKASLRGFRPDTFLLHSEAWYRERDIRVMTGCKITALMPWDKAVGLADGSALTYDTCVYALGAESFIPPIPGSEKPGVSVIRRLSDIASIRLALLCTRDVVVIGGGVIGLEAAWEFRQMGCSVTVLELAPTLLGRLLDSRSARRLQDAVERQGIAVRTGISIEAITGRDRADGVQLSDGAWFPGGMVVLACGIQSNTGLTEAAGADTGRGILVNDRMETSLPWVYACGDCAAYGGAVPGLWDIAVAQGKVAGANAAGQCQVFQSMPSAVVFQGMGTSLFAAGDVSTPYEPDDILEQEGPVPARSGFVVNEPVQDDSAYARYFFRHGFLTGVVLMGDLGTMPMLKQALAERWTRERMEKEVRH